MSKKTLKNEKFLKETVEKLQNQLTKFIIDTNYTNSYSLSLRQKLSNFETKLQKKILHDKKASLQQNKQISSLLPQILSNHNPNKINSPNSLYNIKAKTNNQIITITKQTPKIEENTKTDNNSLSLSQVHNSPKSFSVGKFIKYSSEKRAQNLYHNIKYDTRNYPIIRNKEMKQGLLEMINKGLIPKIADLSPAFEKNGNPININSKSVKLNYTKQN